MSQGELEGQKRRLSALNEPENAGNLLAVGLVSLVVGAGTGVVSAAFRLVLANADRLRDAFLLCGRGQAGPGAFVWRCWLCAAAAVLAALLVWRFSPYASGSGIPHVESALARGAAAGPACILIPIKFFPGGAGYRLWTRARPRGSERADGRDHRQSAWRVVSSGLEKFSGLARRRRGGGARRGLQRAGRRGDIRVGGIQPGVRASHRDSGNGASATAISVSQAILQPRRISMSGNWRSSARRSGRCFSCLASSRAAPRCFTARRCSGSCHWRKASTGVSSASMRRSPERWSARWRGWRRPCRRRRRHHSKHAAWNSAAARAVVRLPFPLWLRRGFLRHRDAGGNIRANARFGRAARVDLRANLPVHLSGP